jgi:hypothetical protein
MFRALSCATLIVLFVCSTAVAVEERWVLAAASNAGHAGTNWTTDAWIYTRIVDSPIQVSVAFFPDVSGTQDPTEVVVDLPPVTSVEIKDIVRELFAENRPGALRFRSEHPFEVRTRTFNDGGDGGTFGQGIPGLGIDEVFEAGALIGAANHPGATGIRTNVGITNPNDVARDALVAVIDQESQQLVGTIERIELGMNGWYQGNVFDLVGAADQTIENAVVVVTGGDLFSYISRIDNQSGDATLILPFDANNLYAMSVEWEVTIALTLPPNAAMSYVTYTGEDGADITVEGPEDGWSDTLHFMSPDEFCFSAEGTTGDWGGNIEIEVLSARGDEPQARHTYARGSAGAATITFSEKCVELY